MKEIHTYKKGERVHLDDVYRIYNLIPLDCTYQDDINDSTCLNDNDSGESVLFLKNVKIEISITVT